MVAAALTTNPARGRVCLRDDDVIDNYMGAAFAIRIDTSASMCVSFVSFLLSPANRSPTSLCALLAPGAADAYAWCADQSLMPRPPSSGGVLVDVSSNLAFDPRPGFALYATSKA